MTAQVTKRLRDDDLRSWAQNAAHDIRSMALELLAYRTRDVTTKAAQHLHSVVCNGIWSRDLRDQKAADVAIDELLQIVAVLHKQLQEAQKESTNAKQEGEVADQS